MLANTPVGYIIELIEALNLLESKMKIMSEWFWSEQSAEVAAARFTKKGYRTTVRYAMAVDGSYDWLLEVFEAN